MPKMSDHEEYLNGSMVQNGDCLVLLDAGVFVNPEESGLSREIFRVQVGLPDQRKKLWTMNKTTRNRLAAEWGDNSESWVNKVVKVEKARQNVRGEMKDVIFGFPTEQKPAEQPKPDKSKQAEAIIDGIQAIHKDLSRDVIEKRIEELMNNSAGALTRDAAAFMLSRELGRLA